MKFSVSSGNPENPDLPENLDHPETDDSWLQYVNSRYENGEIHMLHRPLTGRYETYEHSH